MYNNVHLVLYSNGAVFDSTKHELIQTIKRYSSKNVIVHSYNLNRIKQSTWFNNIESLPELKYGDGRRDGYYNCWKVFIVDEVYKKIGKNDILYYVDCSQYFKNGFTENIDKLCNIVIKEGIIAGSVGIDIRNNSFKCCDNINLWNKIINNNNNILFLNKPHVLNSWFILIKNSINSKFIDEWKYWCIYKDDEFKNPLITYHHTADQSIFNILVYKYKFKVFFCNNIGHNKNKDRNIVLRVINNSCDIDKYFIIL
tara:strand:- start:705 stop:1469 length:765 start_codon:yes stop_codon:yes gene_type:complete